MDDSVSGVDTINCKDDIQSKNESLMRRLEELEKENKENQETFGKQRAQLKDYVLNKEDELKKLESHVRTLQSELDEARSQITVAELSLQATLEEKTRRHEEEISSLQKLVADHLNGQEAIEKGDFDVVTQATSPPPPSAYEISNLRSINEKLAAEITHLRTLVHTDSSSLLNASTGEFSNAHPLLTAPSAMFQTLKSLSKNVAGVASSPVAHVLPSSDSLEEARRKVKTLAEEDAEVLRSLVIPLEDEIKTLKQMLRATDEELRKYKKLTQDSVFEADLDLSETTEETSVDLVSLHSNNSSSNTNPSRMRYSQSSNKSTDLSPSRTSLPLNSEPDAPPPPRPCDECCSKEKLVKDHQARIRELEKHVTSLEKVKEDLRREQEFRKEMEEKWNEKKEQHKTQISELSDKLIIGETELRELRDTYDHTFDEVRRQVKSLEDDRRECQMRIAEVQRRNEILAGMTSRTAAELQDESINLPDSIQELQEMILHMREELIRSRVGKEEADERVHVLESAANQMGTVQAQLASYKSELSRFEEERKTLQAHLRSKNQRISQLQKELENQEKNQQDFVLLSQSLQQTLESTNASNEVRWQHEDDIENCNGCKNLFDSAEMKLHCLHCGKVFCSQCVRFKVPSGPNQRPAEVCETCHVILVKDRSSVS